MSWGEGKWDEAVAQDMIRLQADNARLRALVKEAEWKGCVGRDSDPACPWCGEQPPPLGSGRHVGCDVFLADGEVK